MVEQIEHSEESKLTTWEYAKKRNETSRNSRLPQIKNRLDKTKKPIRRSEHWGLSWKYEEIEELKDLINNQEYREFQKTIWMSFKDCDGKLWPKTLDYLGIYIEKIVNKFSSMEEIQEELDSLWEELSQWERQNREDNMKINRSAREYLLNYETLSESEYDRNFSGKEQLAQWQLGNCYLVSWINELANTQYFDVLMRTSIARVQFKDDNSYWYTIKIPLWEPNGRDILIKDSELSMSSLNWNDWYKLLEIAYAKNRRRNDRTWNKYSPVSQREMQGIDWWWMSDVLRTFLGRNNIWFSDFWSKNLRYSWRPLSKLPQSRKTEITNYLKNFDWNIWNNFTELATPPSSRWDKDSFTVWWNELYNQHDYALSSVDKDSNWDIERINVKNPWNDNEIDWGDDLALTLPEFFNAFSYIWIWKIKVDTFLDNRWFA